MIDTFEMHIFYLDGQFHVSGEQTINELSDKWMSVCTELLENNGSVFNYNMGSTLFHFDIKIGDPTGQLNAYNQTCYDFAISLNSNSTQDQASLSSFEILLNQVAETTKEPFDKNGIQVARDSASKPTLMVFDRCILDVDDQQKIALMQLVIHLAASYFRYYEAI